ncbi:helix-turn-helix domain-containing protein [Virgibacillus sediminis]|uniref:Helix-turn-helix domain-containing protein n=1 Tax=Virgibacillus sediminis TaxID=202260 RepID=A0ABV7A8U9_9BACI
MTKQSSNLTYLSDYATFDNKQELNHHVSQHEKAHADVLNATMRNVLRFIARYSVKYPGASHLKVSTIAEGCGKSERTIGRVLNRLESLDIIRRVGMIRPKSGGKGASIIVIQPFMSERMTDSEVDEKASASKDERTNSEDEPLRKREKHNYVLESAKAVRNNIPAPIYDTLSPFFNAKDLRRLTGIILRSKRKDQRLEAHREPLEGVLLDVIRRFKERSISNLDGYLYQSCKRLFKRLYWEDLHVAVYGA